MSFLHSQLLQKLPLWWLLFSFDVIYLYLTNISLPVLMCCKKISSTQISCTISSASTTQLLFSPTLKSFMTLLQGSSCAIYHSEYYDSIQQIFQYCQQGGWKSIKDKKFHGHSSTSANDEIIEIVKKIILKNLKLSISDSLISFSLLFKLFHRVLMLMGDQECLVFNGLPTVFNTFRPGDLLSVNPCILGFLSGFHWHATDSQE